jgi:hypothetical protein
MKDQTQVKLHLGIQGILNYFGFFIILSSSESICDQFGKQNYVPLLPLLATITGIIMICLNATFIRRYPSKSRIILNSCFQGFGYLFVALGCLYDFYLVVIGILIMGCGSAFGEVTMYGYIENYPSIFVGAFAAGSGICGLSSSLVYLLF